jgi:GxxExxY protein
MPLPLESLTSQILEAAFEVSNELGTGFLESVYEQSLFIALKDKGVHAERQVPIKVFFRGQLAGVFQADLVAENEVILELKAVKTLVPEHVGQTLNYLKATGKPVAMLLNFGSPRLEWRRFDNRFKEEINRDEGDEGDKSRKDGQPYPLPKIEL